MSRLKIALFCSVAVIGWASSGWAAPPESPAVRRFRQALHIEHEPGERFRFRLNVDADGVRAPRLAAMRGFLHRHVQVAHEINIDVLRQPLAPAPVQAEPMPAPVQPSAAATVCKPVCVPVRRCVPRRRWRR